MFFVFIQFTILANYLKRKLIRIDSIFFPVFCNEKAKTRQEHKKFILIFRFILYLLNAHTYSLSPYLDHIEMHN